MTIKTEEGTRRAKAILCVWVSTGKSFRSGQCQRLAHKIPNICMAWARVLTVFCDLCKLALKQMLRPLWMMENIWRCSGDGGQEDLLPSGLTRPMTSLNLHCYRHSLRPEPISEDHVTNLLNGKKHKCQGNKVFFVCVTWEHRPETT